MRYCEHDHIRADLQGGFVFVAVAVGVGELLPAVAEVEFAVNDGQLAVERDAFEFRRGELAEIFAHAGRVIDLLDIVMAVKQRMLGRQLFERFSGQHFRNLVAKGGIEGQTAAAGVGQQQPAGFEILFQRLRIVFAKSEFVMAREVKQRIGGRLRVFRADLLAFEFHFQGGVIAGEFQQIVNAGRIGVPIAVVDELGEHEIVARGAPAS